MKRVLATLVCLPLLAIAPRATAAVSFLTVTTSADSGDGSLRKAIADAVPGQEIRFHASLSGKTITLTGGELVISKSLTIDATLNGVQEITISGGSTSRVIEVTAGPVILAGLTLRDGFVNAGGGGGLHVGIGCNVSLRESTITENRSTVGGGGIRNDGVLNVALSTISGNTAISSYGGGIDNVFGAQLTVVNSTISGNRAYNGAGLDNFGSGSAATLTHVTVARNVAAGTGGGIFRDAGDNGTITLQKSIVAENDAPAGPDCGGNASSLGYNLVERTAGCTIGGTLTGNLTNVAALLAGLMPNSNPRTATHALLGSPAADAIPVPSCVGVSIDQRGLPRGASACDIGAYERTPPILVNSLADPTEGGKCTFRDAVIAANTNSAVNGCSAGTAGSDAINFTALGTIQLGSPVAISETLEVLGPDAGRLVLSGGGAAGILSASFAGSVTLTGLTFADANFAPAVQTSGLVSLGVDGCLFRDNGTVAGGSPHLDVTSGRLDVRDTTFVSGPSTGGFAGVGVIAATGSFTNTTFDSVGGSQLAAVQVKSPSTVAAQALFVNSTFRGTSGAGLLVYAANAEDVPATARSRGSVFSGFAPNIQLQGFLTTHVSLGYNVSSDASGSLTATGDAPSTDPKLGPLRWNAGPVPTLALLPGSPALDRIPFDEARATADARGVSRWRDGSLTGSTHADSGAFEATRPIVVNSLLDTADPSKCRLRDAIEAANTNAAVNGCVAGSYGLDSVRFVPGASGTIALGSTLTAGESMLVEGPGADRLAWSGGNAVRVFQIAGGPVRSFHALHDLTIQNGQAADGAGTRMFAVLGALSIDRCEFKDNVATGVSGGGSIYTIASWALHVSNSAFRNTRAASIGGGVQVTEQPAWFTNCTFAESSSGDPIRLDAINVRAELNLTHCTLSGSESAGVGALGAGRAALRLRANVLAGYVSNILASGTAVITSLGHNVSDDGTGPLSATGDVMNTDPKLGAFVRNGGPTPTFALKSDSPAVNRVPSNVCRAAYDQRGLRRPSGAACDSGAFERTLVGDVNGDGTVNVSDILYLINHLFAGGPAPVGTANANDDGAVNVSDVLYLINYLFAGGAAPI